MVIIHPDSKQQNVQDLNATISKISNAGLVFIDFSDTLTLSEGDNGLIDSKAMKLEIANKQGIVSSNFNFTWSAKSI
jgi:hypothetical protein